MPGKGWKERFYSSGNFTGMSISCIFRNSERGEERQAHRASGSAGVFLELRACPQSLWGQQQATGPVAQER